MPLAKQFLRSILILAVVLLTVGGATDVGAQAVKIDLPTALAKALEIAPEVKEAQAAIQFAEAQKREVNANRWATLEITGLVGPINDARGNQIHSPDKETDIPGVNVFTRLDGILIQPLYTFGRIGYGLKAAQRGIEVERAGLEAKQAEVALRVKEFYYGLQFAIEAKALLDEMSGTLRGARATAEKLLEMDEPPITTMDLFKLEAYQGMLDSLLAEAVKGISLAQEALAAACGMRGQLLLPKELLTPIKLDLAGLADYQNQAVTDRPEIRQVKHGLKALDNLVKVARAEYNPILFLTGYASHAWAPGRTDIENPFILDEFNHIWAGVAAGFRWQLNFGITAAKVDQAKADWMKLKAQEHLAMMYLPVEAAQAYLELREADSKRAANRKAFKAARRWMIMASNNYDMGVGEIRDLTEALYLYAMQRGEYFKSVLMLNTAWAKLKKATGRPAGEV